jgi:hypothetical protein
MATTRRTVRVRAETFERVAREAARHDEDVDHAADRILRKHLPARGRPQDVLLALHRLEALRSKTRPAAR